MNWFMMRLLARGGYLEGAGDGTEGGAGGGAGGNGGGNSGGSSNAGGSQHRTPEQRESFSREYVSELREENGRYRTKAKEAEERAAAAEKAANDKISEAESRANQRIIKAELKAEALKAGMIDLDGLALADLSKVTLDDKGNVVGGEDAIKALKEAKPYLFNKDAGNTSDTGNRPPPKDGDKPKPVTEMTKEEYAAHKRKMGIR